MTDKLKPDPKGQSLIIAIREFLQDWRKGDFELPKLAQYDVEAIESALDNWLATRQSVYAADAVEACARIAEDYVYNKTCEYIDVQDPETGERPCSLGEENCVCFTEENTAQEIASKIRALAAKEPTQ